MAGDNQYYVDEVHGKQDAMKQIRFASLPPVLQVGCVNMKAARHTMLFNLSTAKCFYLRCNT